ncbi:putative purine-cytosine permease FCY2 [Lophiotrema nucula]|uniref:Putative purine-cytosine permease FCY2 n=1 Tax=Lophiotrema nucula TaxID=690887 RepID=A0A6A5YYK3_9PLEO|nr:putative purine-cytosine permease FCY2 [Lophiotrema nucula]
MADEEIAHTDASKTLAKEVYGEKVVYDVAAGESKAVPWTLRLRALAAKYGAEEAGIERIPTELRTNQNPFDMFTLFASANVCTATLAFGTLGPALFGLGWWDSFLALLFFNIIGAIPPSLIATFGPKTGLRTMVVNRYSFGWWPSKLVALLNGVNMIGWAMVNTIAGAVILYDVGQTKLPLSVAVLLIGLIAIIISITGYQWVHKYERFSWIIMAVCFCIVAGFGAKHFVNVPMGKGPSETSGILSFGTAIWAFQVSWGGLSADYAVYMREDRKSFWVFFWTFNGLFWGGFLVECLGAALMTTVSGSPIFEAAYDRGGVGALLGQLFEGYGTNTRNFGYLIETILSLSVIAVVTANVYSLGLNIQTTSDALIKVPRFVWSLLGGAAFLIAAIAGRNQLQEVMENFLNVIAYWLTPWLTIMLLEHFLWRRRLGYNLEAWNKPSLLPKGFAAIFSFLVGTVICILCMSQTWWVGPIALGVGNAPFGTDISWELGLAVTAALYVPLRFMERKYIGL